MQELSIASLIRRRLRKDWALLISVVLGILVAATLVAGAPIYLRALDRLAFNIALDDVSSRFITFTVFGTHTPLTSASLASGDHAIADAIDTHLSDAFSGQAKYVQTSSALVGLPTRPLPRPGVSGSTLARGYLHSLTGLADNAVFFDGHMAGAEVAEGPSGPAVEGVLGRPTAEWFDLKVGDVLTVVPSVGVSTRITVRIVGVFDQDEPVSPYWSLVGIVFDPEPLEETPEAGVQVVPDEPPVPIFVVEQAMIEAFGGSYRASLVQPIWFVNVDTQGLQQWSISEVSARLEAFQSDLSAAMPGADVLTGRVKGIIDNLNEKSFFAKLPLLLLLSIMVATVLFYLGMAVAYLVQERQGDLALLRTRGAPTLQLLRLYGFEGVVLSALAVAVAPFLAMGLVAVAGKLPSFSETTGGSLLQVELTPAPFLGALTAGTLCLVLIIAPGLLGARGGLVAHKTSSSRPPTASFFHRYYLDFGLIVIGGLVYWELQSRGQIASGGLFEDVQVNETLLLSPVLFLIVVALVFVRFFPLLVRYLSGESADIVRLLVGLTVPSLVGAVVFGAVRDGDAVASIGPSALVVGVGALYLLTYRAERLRYRLLGLVAQSAAIAGFLALWPLEPGELEFVPALGLVAIVPAQVGFLLLKAVARAAPIWLSMALWRMARNPLQYTWLVVLLLLATGLGILSTTFGGTLEKSQRERILYDVASDVRVSGLPIFLPGGAANLKQQFLDTPEVELAALAFREIGSAGPISVKVLAFESAAFQYLSWYRDDFSSLSLGAITLALQPASLGQGIPIPEAATRVGLWVKPADLYPQLSMWMVVADNADKTKILTIGELGPPEWHELGADIPPDLEPPLRLTSIQIFEPGGGGSAQGLFAGPLAGTPGTVTLDNVYASVGPEAERQVLEGFEGAVLWTPIPTSPVPTDTLEISVDEPFRGSSSGVFSFGKNRNKFVRGIYLNPTGGPVPVVASSSFLDATGFEVGTVFIAQVTGRLVPLVIRSEVEYFPTVTPDGGGFVIADLDGLMQHLNLLRHPTGVMPNEIFVSSRPGSEDAIVEAMDGLTGRFGRVKDRASLLASLRLDPLLTVGWRAMVVVALGIFVLAAGLGFVTYLLSFAERSRAEMAFLQSLGLSRRQMLGLIGFEHIAILVVGVGLGTWAGLQMSRLMVSSVAVTETGQEIVPPIIFVTSWGPVALVYAAVAAIVAAALFILNRSVLRLDLQVVSRVAD